MAETEAASTGVVGDGILREADAVRYRGVRMISIQAHFDGKVIVPHDPVDLPRDQALIVRIEPARSLFPRARNRAWIGWLSIPSTGRTCARLCHLAGGELEQIQFLLGHASVQTTERYLGCKQKFRHAVNDKPRSRGLLKATVPQRTWAALQSHFPSASHYNLPLLTRIRGVRPFSKGGRAKLAMGLN